MENIDLKEVGERVRNLRGDLSQPVFAARHGVKQNDISRLETGRVLNPAPGLLLSIARASAVSIEWLLTGDRKTPTGSSVAEDEFIYVPRLQVTAEGGEGFENHDEPVVDHLAFRSDWVRDQLRIKQEYLVSIQTSGDSMEPTISEGDELLVDTSKQEITVDGIYCLKLSIGQLVVKRVQRKPDGELIIVSDNPKYQPFPMEPGGSESMRVIGRVVWIGRKV